MGLFRELKSNLSKVSDWVKFRELGLGRNYAFISTIFEVRKLVKILGLTETSENTNDLHGLNIQKYHVYPILRFTIDAKVTLCGLQRAPKVITRTPNYEHFICS